MIKLMIFDFDGTTVDSMDRLAEIAVEEVCSVYDASEDEIRECYLETSGLPFSEQIERMFPGEKKNSEIVNRFENRKRDELLEYPLFPDTKMTLMELRKRDYIVVISSSNFKENVEVYFKEKGVEVDLLLGFKRDFGKGRPHFDYIKKTFDVDKEEMIFIGDSPMDAKRARDYGIKFICKLGTFDEKALENNPDIPYIYRLSDLLKLY